MLEGLQNGVRAALACAALVALPGQALAQVAQTPCLTGGEVRSLATFALPTAMGGLIANCSASVGKSAFMTTRGRDLVATYAAGKDAAWPAARKAFFKLADNGKGNDKVMADAVANMPDAALQPFVEGMIGSLIGAKLKPGQCVMADKMMRLLSPLPPENMVELLGTVIELAEADKKGPAKGLAMCR